jgi:hypothetical protein
LCCRNTPGCGWWRQNFKIGMVRQHLEQMIATPQLTFDRISSYQGHGALF